METKDMLNKGLGMEIGDGRHTEFWNHRWTSDTILAHQALRPIPEEHRGRRIRDYWQQGRGWDWSQLSQLLPSDVLKQVASFELIDDEVGDRPIWTGGNSSQFTIKAAFNLLLPSNHTVLGEWRWIWRLKVPYRIQMFIWLIHQGKLLTNNEHFKRHLTSNPYCERCFENIEDLHHVFRFCPRAQEVWQELSREGLYYLATRSEFQGWLRQNLVGLHADPNWAMKFATTLWYIWKWRCASCFNNMGGIPFDKGKFLQHTFQVMLAAAEPGRDSCPGEGQAQGNQWICWEPPPEGWMVLNTDGAVKMHCGRAGAGGVIRNAQGEWIVGFSECLGFCEPLKAELKGVLRGIRLAQERHIPKLLIRSDSMQVINALNTSTATTRKNYFLIQQCKKLLGWDGWTVQVSHCLREANQVADTLATIGSEGGLGITIFTNPPSETQNLLYADARGFSWPRCTRH